MLNNFLKVASRNFRTHPVFSLINVAGFSVGLLCCIFIYLFIEDETRFDRHFESSNDIYRLTTRMSGTQNTTSSLSSAPLADALRSDFEEVEQATRLFKLPGVKEHLVKIAVQGQAKSSFFETDGYLVDSTFFEVFSYTFIAGNPQKALCAPYSIVLSEELARKYFGSGSPLGQPLRVENAWGVYDCAVSGVFKNNPRSHIPAKFFMAMYSGEAGQFVQRNRDWVGANLFFTYLRLRPGSDPAGLERKFAGFLNKHAAAQLAAAGTFKTLGLERLTDIHLSPYQDDLRPHGNRAHLWALGAIGLFILLIACVNYMNLTTARFTRRNREVGVRKALGSPRHALIAQFLSESLAVGLLAYLMAAAAAVGLLPVFEHFTGKNIAPASIQLALAGALLLALLAGLLAGAYPAFYLSAFKPAEAFKNVAATPRAGAVRLRKGLVVFQFAISTMLIISTTVVWQQMRFLQQTDLGFDKEQKLVLPLKTLGAEEKYPELKAAIGRLAEVNGVSACTAHPGTVSFADQSIFPEGATMNESRRINMNYVDEGFVQLMGFELKAGRYASNQFASDTAGIGGWMLNEAAVKSLGLTPETAVGKKFKTEWRRQIRQFEIVGVLKDFHFESLHKKIAPQGFRITTLAETGYGYLVVDLNSVRSWGAGLAAVASAWASVLPDIPFEGTFLDEALQRNYEAERRIFSLLRLFASLAIFISCLGLFALATYEVERRRKEIAVRKAIGASAMNLVRLLSAAFFKPVVIAIVIASPVAYYFMQQWLSDFAYRINIQWWMFAAAGTLAVLIAFLTVSFQSVKAALANPVKSLRSE